MLRAFTPGLSAALVVCALVAMTVSADAPAATTVAGRVADGTLPSAAKGVSVVRAVSPSTTLVLAGARVRRDGTYTLGVQPGVVSVLADVVRLDRSVRSAITPFVRARTGRRTSVRVSLERTRPRKPRARTSAAGPARPAASEGAPVVAVKWFAGSGPYAVLGRGIADIVMTDIIDQGGKDCGMSVVEWNRRDLIQQELDLQRRYPSLFDPSTTVKKRWVAPTVFVQGKVTTTADQVSWSVQIVDAKTGKVLGGDAARADADDVLDAAGKIADRLVQQLCPRTYEVTLDLTTTSTWPSHSASGRLHSAVTATGTATTTATGTGSLVYEGVTYASNDAQCTYAPERSSTGPWKVELAGDETGSLRVTWTPQGEVYATAVVTCTQEGQTSSAGGQPGPLLTNPTPTTFTLPAAGGTQALGGGLAIGTGGWAHTGTLTVKRVAPS